MFLCNRVLKFSKYRFRPLLEAWIHQVIEVFLKMPHMQDLLMMWTISVSVESEDGKLWLPKSEQFELLLFKFQLFERYSRCAHQGPTLHRIVLG
ncbi:hypothetical protein L1887_32248 [Cichorium endivia]|nr:hypothetical protein L1887_32248 [Cichorium endivia]